jgi:hypothetical protein
MNLNDFINKKFIIGIFLGEIIGICLLFQEFDKVKGINEFGIESKIYSFYIKEIDTYHSYYNYYFKLQDGSKIWITHNLNNKSNYIYKDHFNKEIVKYNRLNPNDYVILNENEKNISVGYFYYLLLIPIIIMFFFVIFIPKKLILLFLNLISSIYRK